jgi:hypothetical protein
MRRLCWMNLPAPRLRAQGSANRPSMVALIFRFGSICDFVGRAPDVCFTFESVAKVENRTTPKISRKLIFS